MKHLLLISFFLFCTTNLLFTQSNLSDSPSKRATKIEIGYMLGGTPSYYYLAAYSGPTIGFFHGGQITDRFHLYAGLNLEKLTDRTTIPISADFDFYNKKENQLFNLKVGYAAAWGTKNVVETNYSYKGGLHYSIGYGFDLLSQNTWKLKFMFSYNFRDTKLVYEIESDGTKYEDPSKTHLISLKTIFSF